MTSHTTDINPDMLILAREFRGLSQTKLAEFSSVTQGNISRYESGLLHVHVEHLEEIARALKFPINFFYLSGARSGLKSGCIYHRKRSTMPGKQLKILEANLDLIYMNVERFLNAIEISDEFIFPRYDIEDYDGNIELIARMVRQAWNLPSGPIKNLIFSIEAAGGIVKKHSFNTKKLDAFSKWKAGKPPLIFINSAIPGDRLRFSLAHELGHLIMHRIPTDNPEKEADRFAAEFLMPKTDISAALYPLTWNKLTQLKIFWKVSMAALIKRAYDLEIITHREYQAKFVQLSKLGYRRNEPVSIPIEQPTLLQEIINIHIKQLGYSISQLSQLVCLHEEEFRSLYSVEIGNHENQPNFTLLDNV